MDNISDYCHDVISFDGLVLLESVLMFESFNADNRSGELDVTSFSDGARYEFKT